jgi:hypothetical protein
MNKQAIHSFVRVNSTVSVRNDSPYESACAGFFLYDPRNGPPKKGKKRASKPLFWVSLVDCMLLLVTGECVGKLHGNKLHASPATLYVGVGFRSVFSSVLRPAGPKPKLFCSIRALLTRRARF